MGLVSKFIRSWKKSTKVRRLQLKIAPHGRTVDDVVAGFIKSLAGSSERDKALEEFFDLCESDEGIKRVMASEGITRSDLNDIYRRLSAAGLGQWIKGHYAALSSIAYVEPLLYTVRSQKRGADWRHIAFNLLRYWENEIPQGQLLQELR